MDTPTLIAYFRERFGDRYRIIEQPAGREAILEELRSFGVASMTDLAKLLSDERIGRIDRLERDNTDIGLLRSAMMDVDARRYFEEAWHNHWRVIDLESLATLEDRYGAELVARLVEQYDLSPDE